MSDSDYMGSNRSSISVSSRSIFYINFSETDLSDSFRTSKSCAVEKSSRRPSVWYDLNQEINDLDDDQDVIPITDSERRLNNICIFLSLCLITCSTVFCGISFRVFQGPLIIHYQNDLEPQSVKVPHIVILTSDGSMTPYTWKSNPKTKAVFPKLPKATSYAMARFDQSLYALSLTNFNGMTKIESNGNHRHIHLKRSLLPDFNHGGRVVSINNFLWIIGGNDCQHYIDSNFPEWFDENTWNKWCSQVRETRLWSFRSQKFSNGPLLPLNFYFKYGCALALNRTLVLFIGCKVHNYFTDGYDYFSNGLTYTYNFVTKNWKHRKRMPLENYTCLQRRHYISCGVQHRKNKRYIYLQTYISALSALINKMQITFQ